MPRYYVALLISYLASTVSSGADFNWPQFRGLAAGTGLSMTNRLYSPLRLFLCFTLLARTLAATPPISAAEVIDFQTPLDFLQMPDGYALGACSAVAVSSKDEIYLFHRGKHPILCFDKDGKFLRSWGDDQIHTAHGLRVDKEDNVWATDIGNHRVFKFDPQGKELLALGTGQPGTETDQFDKPTDIAFGPDGEFFVSDGYGNSRVLKFSPNGGFIKTWGTPGMRGGEFNLPHSIVVDAKKRIFVGDRENNRIQVFDLEGKPLAIWRGYAPYGLAFDPSGNLFVADGRANRVNLLDSAGKVKKSWGRKGSKAGQFDLPHLLAFDSAGNLYVAEVNGRRLQKFVRK
ncbi:MAG: peptidyl-alpha-hydroxyglycine alpha-amidating lyase family protein [Pirellulaceae bacterium]